MKVYIIEYGFTRGKQELVGREWVGTQAEATARKKQLMDGVAYDIDIRTMDVPTDKTGLLTWLNEQLSADLRSDSL